MLEHSSDGLGNVPEQSNQEKCVKGHVTTLYGARVNAWPVHVVHRSPFNDCPHPQQTWQYGSALPSNVNGGGEHLHPS